MIIMIPMKSLHPLNLKVNRIQLYISFILIVLGILAVFNQYNYEIEYSNKYKFADITELVYLESHPKQDITYGFWTIPLMLGIVLFCNVFIEMDLSNKSIKNKIKKYIKYRKEN